MMDNHTDIIELLDILYGMVTEAWGVPLGNDKCIIEREKAVDIINEIKANLPSALAEAKRLVSARDEFIGNAKREAEAMRKSAEEKSKAMIEEQEIVRVARARSAEMINSAEAKSRELRRVAAEYVDEIMKQSEESVSDALSKLQKAHDAFNSMGGAAIASSAPTEAPKQPAQEAKPQNVQQAPNAAPKAEAKPNEVRRAQPTPAGKRQGAPITKIPRES